MYPIALILLCPLSKPLLLASFPQDFKPPGLFSVPNPIKELHEWQSFSPLLTIPILTLERSVRQLKALNPSLLQLRCKEALLPINFFHSSRPSDVFRYWPSAIIECRESASLLITINLSCWLIFIPRQILEKDVFQ